MQIRSITLLALVAVVTGCRDEPRPNVEFNMDDDTTFAGAEPDYATDDEFAMLTENGAVKLGLTRERVYFEVSKAVRDHVDEQIEEGMAESDSRIARSISSAVRRGVQSAMSIDIEFDIDEIRDVDYRDGELVFEFENDHERSLDNIDIDDEPITRSFDATDARAFVDAFRRVKGGESMRGDTAFEVRTGTLADTTRAAGDSAGGASF